MSSPWTTGLKSEALEALPEIIELSKDTLTQEKYEKAEDVARRMLKKTAKSMALAELMLEVGFDPKRPLGYLWPELRRLPTNTRNCIRYLGDYIDLIVKEMAFEYLGGRSRQTSLGANAKKLQEVPELKQIAIKLSRFNDFLYQPGKHDFSLPPGRHHRFTSREVVLTAYITKALGDEVKALSRQARIAIEKDDLYLVGGRWGRGVKFAEDSRRPRRKPAL